MGRRSHSTTLAVWMNGEHVGVWVTAANGAQSFVYDDAWIDSKIGRPLSLSLPMRPSSEPYTGPVLEAFFDNLLPDNRDIRSRLRQRFSARSMDAFDLLAELGRDCVGALQILPESAPRPDIARTTAKALDVAEVERAIDACLGTVLGDDPDPDGFRLSLAGAQEKTAFLKRDGAWCEPLGATPSTHIFKLPIGQAVQGLDLSTSVENEWLCARLVAAFGIPVAPCSIETFGARKVLVVERFDRQLSADGSYWLRLPQEDFCQATGTPSEHKYERQGGPSIRRIMDLLVASEKAETDRLDFFRTQVVYWLLAAIDGHAKNFSLFLHAGGTFDLTPRYDILSAHPYIGTGPGQLISRRVRMAMAVSGRNVHYRWDEIQARHWLETARRVRLPDARNRIEQILSDVPGAIDQVRRQVPPGFPGAIAEAIFDGTSSAAETFRSGLAAL